MLWIWNLKTTNSLVGPYLQSIASRSSLTILLARCALNQIGDKSAQLLGNYSASVLALLRNIVLLFGSADQLEE